MKISVPPSALPADLPEFLRTPAVADAPASGAEAQGLRAALWQALGGRFRLLPLVMVCGVLLLGFKLTSLAAGTVELFDAGTMQRVQAVTPAAGKESGTSGEKTGQATPQVATDAPDDPLADAEFMSRSEVDLLQNLSARRQALDTRADELDTRERLLMATEQRIDRKIDRLKSIEARINSLLQAHSEQEEEQLATLVRVYESMKPKEAAVILERLEMDILVNVIERMNNRKLALVMAQMNPDMAKKLTVELATRKQLPAIDG